MMTYSVVNTNLLITCSKILILAKAATASKSLQKAINTLLSYSGGHRDIPSFQNSNRAKADHLNPLSDILKLS